MSTEAEAGPARGAPLVARAGAALAIVALPLIFGNRHALRTQAALFVRGAIVALGSPSGVDALFGPRGTVDLLLALAMAFTGVATLGAVVLALRSPRQPRLAFGAFAGGWIVSSILGCAAAMASESEVRGRFLGAVQESMIVRLLLGSEVRVHSDVAFGLGAALVLALASMRTLRAPPRTARAIALVALAVGIAIAARAVGRPLSRCHLLGLLPIAIAAAGAVRTQSPRDRALGIGALVGAALALDHAAHLATVARALRLLYDATPAGAVVVAGDLEAIAAAERASLGIFAADALAVLLAASAHGLSGAQIGRALATAAWPLTVCVAWDSAAASATSSVAALYARYEAFDAPAVDAPRVHAPHPKAPLARVDAQGKISWAESNEPFVAREAAVVDLVVDPDARVAAVLRAADALAKEGSRRTGANKDKVQFGWIARPLAEERARRSWSMGGLAATRRATLPVVHAATVDAGLVTELEKASGSGEWVVVNVDPSGTSALVSSRAASRRAAGPAAIAAELEALGLDGPFPNLALVPRPDDTAKDAAPWAAALLGAVHARAGTAGRDRTVRVVVTHDRAGVTRHALTRPPAKAKPAPPVAARPSPGCGRGEHLPAFSRRAVRAGGRERAYDLAVPSGGAGPRPLVFAFHGGGGTPEDMRAELALEAAMPDAIVAYPAGRGGVWDIVSPPKDNADLAFFDEVLAFVLKAECVDESRVFLTGYSMGGYFATQLACRRAPQIRAIATHAAGGPYLGPDEIDEDGQPRCPGRVAALVVHGKLDDNVVPREGEGTLRHFRTRSACSSRSSPLAPAPCVSWDGCASDAPVASCWVPDVGHFVWPTEGGKAVAAFFGRFSP